MMKYTWQLLIQKGKTVTIEHFHNLDEMEQAEAVWQLYVNIRKKDEKR